MSASPDAETGLLVALDDVRASVDAELLDRLGDRRAELAGMDPSAAALVDEIRRLVGAGGTRIRPSLCVWAHRAAGARREGPVLRAAAALELLHTFALVHDDVMDGASVRRGVETTRVRFAALAPPGLDPERYGTSVAILVGDLAAVLAERTLRSCGAPPAPLALALDRFDRMRLEMGAGQFLDLSSPPGPSSARIAALKTGSYTAEGPVLVGTALAEAGPSVERPLRTFAGLLGEAFQLRDDVVDGDALSGEHAERVDRLVDRAIAAVEGVALRPDAARALAGIAGLVRIGPR